MRLEVIVEWCGSVFEVRHLSEGEAFRLGDDLPHEIEATVARVTGGEARLRAPRGADAELLLEGATQTFVADRPTRLAPGARARMRLGELSLYFATVEAATPPPRGLLEGLIDREGAGGLGGALLLHALAVLIIVSAPVDPQALSLISRGIDQRFVDVMLIPDAPEPPELAPELPAGGAEGDPAVAGEATPRSAPVATTPTAGPSRATRRTVARRTARAVGDALEEELSSVFASAPGGAGGTSAWLPGLSPSGGGPLAGLGPLAPGGDGFGAPASVDVRLETGGVASGLSPGRPPRARTPRAGRRQPKVVPLEPRVAPGLEREEVRRVIRRHRAQYRACYEKRLQAVRGLNGKIVMRFVVGQSGRVVAAAVESSTMKDAQVEGCLRRRMMHWHFPRPVGGGTVAVRYPFLFKPS